MKTKSSTMMSIPVSLEPKKNCDPRIEKLVMIYYLNHRILAKIFDTDTLESFINRVSK